MSWPLTLRVIMWRDYLGVTHAIRQSKNHPQDWDPICDARTSDFGSHDTERTVSSIRNASIIPVPGPMTCLVCAARLTE